MKSTLKYKKSSKILNIEHAGLEGGKSLTEMYSRSDRYIVIFFFCLLEERLLFIVFIDCYFYQVWKISSPIKYAVKSFNHIKIEYLLYLKPIDKF